MRKTRFSPGRKALVWMVVGLVLAALVGLSPNAVELGKCEQAFADCMQGMHGIALGVGGHVYCMVGYAFCKKYIDV